MSRTPWRGTPGIWQGRGRLAVWVFTLATQQIIPLAFYQIQTAASEFAILALEYRADSNPEVDVFRRQRVTKRAAEPGVGCRIALMGLMRYTPYFLA